MNYFDPWVSTVRGLEAEQKIATAGAQGRALQDLLAEREALAMMGQGDQLTGYEDVPEAKRPAAIKRLMVTNPELALQMEARLAGRFANQREIEKALAVEQGKKDIGMSMFERFEGGEGGPTSPAAPEGVAGSEGAVPPAESEGVPYMIAAPTPAPAPAPSRNRFGARGEPGTVMEWSLAQGPKITRDYGKAAQIKLQEREREQADVAQKETQRKNIQDNIDSLRTRLRTTPPEDLPRLKSEIDYLTKRRTKIEQELGFETPAAAAARPAPTALPSAAAPVAPAPRQMIGDVDISGLPAETREKLVSEKAKTALELEKTDIEASKAELVEARKTAKNFEAVRTEVDRLQHLAAIPIEKDGFVVDVTKKPGVMTGPFWGMAPSVTPYGKEVDQIIGRLNFQNIPKGSAQILNSEGERKLYEKGNPQTTNDPITNYNSSQVLRSQADNAKDYPHFIERWLKKNKTRSGAQEFWDNYVEYQPNFVLDDETGIMQKNAGRVPIHVWEQGEAAADKYLDAHLKQGKLYPTTEGRRIYAGRGQWATPQEWAGRKR